MSQLGPEFTLRGPLQLIEYVTRQHQSWAEVNRERLVLATQKLELDIAVKVKDRQLAFMQEQLERQKRL